MTKLSFGLGLMVGSLLFWVTSASAGDLQEQIELCTSCHGEAGLPEDPGIPIIWGQELYYLYVQLRDYKAGRRANEIMSGIVSELEKADMQALAKHFSEQEWPRTGYRAEAAQQAQGERGTIAGQCPQCHLGSYLGNSRVPRVAGQKVEYLARTMIEFKHKVRLNSPAKGSLMTAYEDTDITAMAQFLAGF